MELLGDKERFVSTRGQVFHSSLQLQTIMSARISDRQKEILITFLETNFKLVSGKLDNTQTVSDQNRLWQSIADKLNAMDGAIKTAEKWKRAWYDIKMAAKKLSATIRDHTARTGGGPPTTELLSPLQERIVFLLGEVQIFGDPQVAEGGFDTPEPLSREEEVILEEDDNGYNQTSPATPTPQWQGVHMQVHAPSPVTPLPDTSNMGKRKLEPRKETPPNQSRPTNSDSSHLIESQRCMAESLKDMVAIGRQLAEAEERKATSMETMANAVKSFVDAYLGIQ